MRIANSYDGDLKMGMVVFLYFSVAILVLAALFFSRAIVRGYLRFRGTRLVTCPETKRPAAVELDALRAARNTLLGKKHDRLKDCSRWPESQDCGQTCLSQIERAPENCLLWTIISRWYEDKRCVLCGKAFGQIQWYEHQPGLMSDNRSTAKWDQFRAEEIPDLLKTHYPVCWDCHMAEKFRREYPELVIERPRSKKERARISRPES